MPASTSAHQLAVEWKAKGDRLYAAPGTTIREDGKTFTCLGAYVEALRHDPEYGAAWGRVAKCTRYADKVLVNDKLWTMKDSAVQALTFDPTNADGWHALGSFTGGNSTVVFHGVEYTSKDCYFKAVKCDPKHSSVWAGFGYAAHDCENEEVIVDGEAYSTIAAYRKCVLLDPNVFSAWLNLSCVLRGALVEIDGKKLTENDCLRRALECKRHPFESWTTAEAWNRLYHSLPENGTVLINGTEYTELDTAIEQVEHDPFSGYTWDAVAYCLHTDLAKTVLINDKPYTCRDCCIQALQQTCSYRNPWHRLAITMNASETVVVNGDTYDKAACRRMAEEP